MSVRSKTALMLSFSLALASLLAAGCAGVPRSETPPPSLSQLDAMLAEAGLGHLAVDCFIMRAAACNEQVNTPGVSPAFDATACRAERLPLDERGSRDCVLRGDLDGDGRDDLLVTVRTRDGGERGLAIVEADGDVQLLAAGTRQVVRHEDPSPGDEPFGPDLDWAHGLELIDRNSRSRCPHLVPPEGAAIEIFGACEAYALLVAQDGAWMLRNCGI